MEERIGKMRLADEFTGCYPVQKTLRFELIPKGKTLEFIKRDGILDTDSRRAESYQMVKKIIDQYHKVFIDEALYGLELQELEEYQKLYEKTKRDEKEEKKFQNIQMSLRKQIAKSFKSHPKYKNLLKGELIKKELIPFVGENKEKQKLIEEFKDFSTYFSGFFINRSNIYSDEEKSTAIGYRIVHQNLPKYIDNMKIFQQIKNTDFYELISQSADIKEKAEIDDINSLFELEGYNKVLTQRGIENYNCILGGFSKENGEKIRGLNECINWHNQHLEKQEKKIPKLKPLYKQILSDQESKSFVIEKFETDQDVRKAIDKFYTQFTKKVISPDAELSLEELLQNMNTYDLDKIYITNDKSISDISQYLFRDWSVLKNTIADHYDKVHFDKKANKNPEKYYEKKAKDLKRIKSFSITELNHWAEDYTRNPCIIQDYFINQIDEKVSQIEAKYQNYKKIFQDESDNGISLQKDKKFVAKIKELLDSIKELQKLVSPLLKGQEEAEKDELFYVELIRMSDSLNEINSLYNKVRNYVTKKPYSIEKVKLNFNKPTLLDGWDRNKEKDNLCTILEKEGLYYLGIMNKKSNHVLEEILEVQTENVYHKMEYKLLPGPNKMLPKVFFSKSRIKEFAPDEELLRKYKAGTHKKGENFNLEDCHKLIDFFKDSIQKHEDWSQFDFHFSDTETYEDISGFYREVEQQGYKITFKDVDACYIEQLVEKGQLYLFQIYNKDFSPYSKGRPNLHTMYWKMLFSPENLKNVVYKLNGQAEIFYRKKSIDEKNIVEHESHEKLKNKYPETLKKYNPEKYKELKDQLKETSEFPYKLIKDKRFTIDKFQFHVPITMNFQAHGENYMNRKVNQCIHDCKDLHIIGIDRGERNLLYITIIDMNGKIVEKGQISLNEIVSYNKKEISCKKDYHTLLDQRENDNKKARQNWQTINTIKELKEGYLSQVIHVISKMMIKYNAIIVLEDLNFGFMRSRQKFEKQVYQKFEKMLIDKLNYLVDKSLEPNENGGILKAYQLTNKFESFQKIGKQSGFLYYIPAWNTSKMDPTTGFVNLFYTRYETKEKSQVFIRKFDSISYNEKEDYFEFEFDYSNFTYKADGSRTKWCVCSNGERILRYRNPEKNMEWESKKIHLTTEFQQLFEKYQINWQEGNLIERLTKVEKVEFYRSFMHLMTLTLQMRNSNNKTNEDYILSPVKNEKGEFFRTDPESELYPHDADANGAYNIAKKGLWIVEQIQKTDIDKLDKLKLAISNKEWLAYAQEHRL
jgi:CRISPR-associated protein Cpf1